MYDKNVIHEIIEKIGEELNGILRSNLYELSLKQEELLRLRNKKRELRKALKNCGIGDLRAKIYVKTLIKDILTEKFNIDAEKMNSIVPFDSSELLSVKDKFDILLYVYKKDYGSNAFIELVEKYKLLEMPGVSEDEEYHTTDYFTEDQHGMDSNTNGEKYEITQRDIEKIFRIENCFLSYEDKLEIISQKVYEAYRGLGIVDELRDMKLDGISGGVSGREGDYHSVWAFIKGKTVHMSFLDFETESELERVCMNIYRYNHPGHLSRNKGYIVNEMKDHSRVVVARPPFCESFVFFVRKFDTIKHKTLDELITDENREIPISILKWIVKGCQVTAVTGAQGSGKTTLLMALIGYIHPAYTLRVQELSFELHLRDIYTDRNIVTFQETDYISGQEGLDLQKKTDGVVNILGEVATAPVASWMIQMSMTASLFTMFTHHAKTTKSLIKYMRNSLLTDGAFRNEVIAEEQVVDTIRFDVHLEKDLYGHRYIERISEIIPTEERGKGAKLFEVRNLVEYQGGRYVKGSDFSMEVRKEIEKHLTTEEKEEFCEAYPV